MTERANVPQTIFEGVLSAVAALGRLFVREVHVLGWGDLMLMPGQLHSNPSLVFYVFRETLR